MRSFLKLGLLSSMLIMAASTAMGLDGVVLIANEGVSVAAVSDSKLKDIYMGKSSYWDGGQAVVIYVLTDKTDAAIQKMTGMDGSQFKTFWQRMAFSGRGSSPKKVDDIASLVSSVASTKGAIALVPADTELKGVKKLDIK